MLYRSAAWKNQEKEKELLGVAEAGCDLGEQQALRAVCHGLNPSERNVESASAGANLHHYSPA
ncbi:MAG: hypothetical protein HY569_01365 [Candidatus Magasanikbacteria bacterium]|nr:hypothetical protein [Candidatus Magasanikbacteria bacterium]